jgi:hypothetical protein
VQKLSRDMIHVKNKIKIKKRGLSNQIKIQTVPRNTHVQTFQSQTIFAY